MGNGRGKVEGGINVNLCSDMERIYEELLDDGLKLTIVVREDKRRFNFELILENWKGNENFICYNADNPDEGQWIFESPGKAIEYSIKENIAKITGSLKKDEYRESSN